MTAHDAQREEEAMLHYRHCLRLAPEHRDALWNYGEILRLRERFAEATQCFDKLHALGAWYDWLDYRLAAARLGCGDLRGARQAFDRELARVDPAHAREQGPHPASALVHWEYAHLLLLAGEFERGFIAYEHRFAAGDRTGVHCAAFDVTRWQGEPLAGKALLVHGEQGLGDHIMFAALVSHLLRELGPTGRLLLAVAPPLVRLFSLAWPQAAVLPHTPQTPVPAEAVAGIDYETPICSLARWRMPPGPQWLHSAPPYLCADAPDQATVRAYLQALVPGIDKTLKVGLMWGSNPAVWDAKAAQRARQKTISLAALAPLRQLQGATFVSLQNSDLALDAANAPFDLVDCHALLNDMAATAALVAEMDVVVSVDTSVAHLAGAMGKPVLLLLMQRADWRWLRPGQPCPWYANVTALRQKEQGDWAPVVGELVRALKRRVRVVATTHTGFASART